MPSPDPTPPALTVSDALFLDFDGTLAPLVADPDSARLLPEQSALLERLAGRLSGALCLISGRALDDLASRSPVGLWRAGGHGIDLAAPGQSAAERVETPPDLLAAVAPVVAGFPAARIETKGPVVAVHYRADPDSGPALAGGLKQAISALHGYRLHGGKMVWEIKPEGRDKGRALHRLMLKPPFAGRRPVMLGDDVTDEDGFAAVQEHGGLAVKVGPGPSRAAFRLPGVPAVWDWLRGLESDPA
ncbi:trehalose-phosphatase [Frigidibacter sp. ROC022]|uniref:trehalose-phosphatase n=1 Tax=Frigidibacter sp. ROC022 TaxID=2971796 RepID=UPI00215AE0D3|nr:trehalose-phosphatase [Frigidibacter sp. ROC022]MCR8724308.1 trehalose-phosphatase [Frigidibacter sp. ROC022]